MLTASSITTAVVALTACRTDTIRFTVHGLPLFAVCVSGPSFRFFHGRVLKVECFSPVITVAGMVLVSCTSKILPGININNCCSIIEAGERRVNTEETGTR